MPEEETVDKAWVTTDTVPHQPAKALPNEEITKKLLSAVRMEVAYIGEGLSTTEDQYNDNTGGSRTSAHRDMAVAAVRLDACAQVLRGLTPMEYR